MTGFTSSPANTLADIEARAADWIAASCDREKWRKEDEAALEAWLNESPAHEVAHLRLRAIWNSADRLAILRQPAKAQPQQARKAPFYRAIASAFVAAVLIAAGYFYLAAPRAQTYTTAIGKHETVALADGSSIELNTNTVLRTDFDRNARTVTLVKGEAYFQIRHDAARPFTVHFGIHRITDLGTKFLARGRGDHLELSLLEGRARIQSMSGTGSRSAILNPGDVAVATNNALSVSKTSTQALVDKLGWRSGVVVFHDTALAEVADEFNRYNTNKIVLADNAAGRRRIGGTFSTKDVRQFVIIVRDVLGLHVENRGDEIVISR